uniref:Uncharacterized protein n=1 Tax=Panagrellus redivivus TaxID=6233 RepID=A0A7E4VRL0_PANRE
MSQNTDMSPELIEPFEWYPSTPLATISAIDIPLIDSGVYEDQPGVSFLPNKSGKKRSISFSPKGKLRSSFSRTLSTRKVTWKNSNKSADDGGEYKTPVFTSRQYSSNENSENSVPDKEYTMGRCCVHLVKLFCVVATFVVVVMLAQCLVFLLYHAAMTYAVPHGRRDQAPPRTAGNLSKNTQLPIVSLMAILASSEVRNKRIDIKD